MTWLNNWKPKDVIALVLVIGAFVMMGFGRNGIMEWIILSVGAAYGVASMGHMVIDAKNRKIEINPEQPAEKPADKPAAAATSPPS